MQDWDWTIKGLTVTASNKRTSPHRICSFVFSAESVDDIPRVKQKIISEIDKQLIPQPTPMWWFAR